jgi:hypothetical protein
MVNEDVVDLYSRVNLGTKVVVLPMTRAPAHVAQAKPATPAQPPMSAQPTMQVTSSYAPASAPQAAWDGIRVRGVY